MSKRFQLCKLGEVDETLATLIKANSSGKRSISILIKAVPRKLGTLVPG